MKNKKRYFIDASIEFEIESIDEKDCKNFREFNDLLEKKAKEKIIENFKDDSEITISKNSIQLHWHIGSDER